MSRTMKQYPKDQFDNVPRSLLRVGAHRADLPSRRGWFWFGLAVLACGVLVVGGIVALSVLHGSLPFGSSFTGQSKSASPQSSAAFEPVKDPTTIDQELGLTITVLNGTAIEGLQDSAGDLLAGQQWPVGARNVASSTEVADTTVYYNAAVFEGIALGVLEALGGIGSVERSDAYLGAPITVMLGEDYAQANAT